MARCSRCGVVETSLYIMGLPVCLDCNKKEMQQSPDSPWSTGSNQRPNPPKRVQNTEDSKPAAATTQQRGGEA